MILFGQVNEYEYFQRRKKSLEKEIDSLTNSELESSDDSLKIILKAKHSIRQVEFGTDNLVDKGEIINGYQKGRRIEVHLPFSCEKDILSIQPSTRYIGLYPQGEVVNSEVVFAVDFYSSRETAEDVKHKIGENLEVIKDYAGWLNNDINGFNNSIEKIIDNNLPLRRNKLAQDDAILGMLNVQKSAVPTAAFVKPEKKSI
jgi:hypothetical protein